MTYQSGLGSGAISQVVDVSAYHFESDDIVTLKAFAADWTSSSDAADLPGRACRPLRRRAGVVQAAEVAGPRPIDVGFFFGGTPAASQTVKFIATRAFTLPADLAGSQGHASTAATAQADFDIRKNGGSIGTASFAASASSATFTFASAVSFAAGDRLEVTAPASPDATLADVAITLTGTRS